MDVCTASTGSNKIGQPNALRFGNEPEEVPVAIEAPRATRFNHLDRRFVVAVEELISQLTSWVFVCEFQRFRSEPLHAYDRHETVRQNAFDRRSGSELIEAGHAARDRSRCDNG